MAFYSKPLIKKLVVEKNLYLGYNFLLITLISPHLIKHI